MLKLNEIWKTYRVGDIETRALQGINVAFREKEFVAILGASGSGKTTCLNIIGGLDRYDYGDLVIKGRHTRDFKDRDWDAYRNNSIGFVFQSYNLISHLSIVANVELGMTLSGVGGGEKRKRAIEVLEEVGLKEHLHKKPSQLSGGQMQRVAIARALANNPEILLCDEPTGALDSETSVQIMELIKRLSSDRLVIMVTHNPKLASSYANRVIEFEDGRIVSDSNPYNPEESAENFNLKRTGMSFFTALKLSFNNILTKKGRTFLTAFASSIGIIGIAVILSLSHGFQLKIDDFQRDALSEFPIIINKQTASMDAEKMQEIINEQKNSGEKFPDKKAVNVYDPSSNLMVHENVITEEFISFVKGLDKSISAASSEIMLTKFNVLRDMNGEIKNVTFDNGVGAMGGMGAGISLPTTIPTQNNPDKTSYLEANYDLLYGNLPTEVTDMILVIDSRNRLSVDMLKALGFDVEAGDEISFESFVGMKLKIVPNDKFYSKTESGGFGVNTNFDEIYKDSENIEIKISGVVRLKDGVSFGMFPEGIVYSNELTPKVIEANKNSEIVTVQRKMDTSVLTGAPLNEDEKKTQLAMLGADETPIALTIYPNSFETKQALLDKLDEYNEGKDKEDRIVYDDMASSISSLTGSIMDGITVVLIAFASISLVVSLIMISIITYISVLERTKEIGILRALGARKKDISRVFDAETFILGLLSGLLGVFVGWGLTFPANAVIQSLTDLPNVAQLRWEYAIVLVVISTLLTVLGGHIPAKMASRKDAVEALRSE